MVHRIDRRVLPLFLKAVLPQYDVIFRDLEQAGGWLNLPPQLISNLSQLKLRRWDAYEDPKKLRVLSWLMVVDLDTLLSYSDNEGLDVLTKEILDSVREVVSSEEFLSGEFLSNEELDKLRSEILEFLETAPDEEVKIFWRDVALYLTLPLDQGHR